MARRKAWGRKLVISIFVLFCLLSILKFLVSVAATFTLADTNILIVQANSFRPSLTQVFYQAMTTLVWCGCLLLPVWYLNRIGVREEFGVLSYHPNHDNGDINDT